MKKLKLIYLLILSIGVSILFIGCTGEKDPCEDTAQPEIEVGVKVNVTVLNNDDSPAPGVHVSVVIYKKPCAADPKGHFNFRGVTDENGNFSSTTVYYKLRNSWDQVHVDVKNTRTGETFHNFYSYENFSGLNFKAFNVIIYDN